jgi:hypothetical protein
MGETPVGRDVMKRTTADRRYDGSVPTTDPSTVGSSEQSGRGGWP